MGADALSCADRSTSDGEAMAERRLERRRGTAPPMHGRNMVWKPEGVDAESGRSYHGRGGLA